MKKIAVLICLFLPFVNKAITITSSSGGGSWFSTSTWIGGQIPGNTDDAIIAGGTVTIPSGIALGITHNLTINTGKTLTNNNGLLIIGTFTNNGTLNGTGIMVTYPVGTITSTTSGGIWDSASTWVGGVVPSYGNDVVINGSVSVSSSSPQKNCYNLTINSGKTLTINGELFEFGKLTNNGTFSGGGYIALRGSGMTIVSGGGSFSYSGTYYIDNNSPEADTIASNVTFSYHTYIIYFTTGSFNVSMRLVNMGSIITEAPGGITHTSGGTPCTWINGPNSYLATEGPLSIDTLYASATGNTIDYNGSYFSSYNINQPINSTFYNLQIANTTIHTLNFSPILLGSYTNYPGGVFNMAGYNMTIAGNWINNITSGSISNQGTITFNGNSDTIEGTATTTFNNLTINSTGTVFLGHAETVNNNLSISGGTLNCQTYQLTGNTTGTFTMASGTGLLLGLPSSSTNVSFPTSFTTAHTTLNSTSTVTYQANTGQTISTTPSTYGNLVLSTGSSGTSKTPASSPLVIAGNITINSNATLPESTGTINLTGNLINAGTLSFSSGALNIGGNFTNTGTFTYGTSAVTCNGSSAQSISGTSYPTFYNLTISGGSGQIVSLGNNQTINNTLSITSGVLDATTSNYNLTIGANFTKTGGTFTPRSGTVTMNGSSAQTLGGTSSLTMNKLVVGTSGTTTLGGNITTTSTITINSGATLDASTSNYNITTAGNWTDNGNFTHRNGTVNFNATGNQCVSNHTSTETFQNMTVSPLTILGTSSTTIDILGTITVLPGGQMACICH